MLRHKIPNLWPKLWAYLTPILLALLFSGSWAVSQAETTTNVGGPIFVNTTWTLANSPYVATNSVQVMDGATLTIEPGVIVRFDAEKALSVSGGLVAQGTEANPITFTANSANPTPGYWGFIKFENSSVDATFDVDDNYTGGSIVQHAIVEYSGSDSNNPAALYLDRAAPYINQNTVRHNRYDGIRADQSSAIVSNNWVESNQRYGIYASSTDTGQPAILNNTILGSGSDGIYAQGYSDTDRVVVQGNTVRGGIYTWSSAISCISALVSKNWIYANAGYGIFAQGYCSVINNIVARNGNTGIYGSNTSSPIRANKVAHNRAEDGSSGSTAGIYAYYASSITYNSIVFNRADAAVPGVDLGSPQNSANCFAYNTVTGQVAASNTDTGGIYLQGGTVDCEVQYNNLYSNQGYELYNNNSQSAGTVDAQFNWWGSTDGTTINNEIYDFFDDGSLSVTNYGNLLTAPGTEAPPAPPTGLQVAVNGTDFDLTWNPNQEADIAGYRVFYDLDSGYPYSGTGATQGASGIDVGNVTSYSLSGLPANTNIYFTVAAYDGSGDPWAGESWYAREVLQAIGGVQNTPTPTPTGPTPTGQPPTSTPTNTTQAPTETPTPTNTTQAPTETPTPTNTTQAPTETPTPTNTTQAPTETPTATPTNQSSANVVLFENMSRDGLRFAYTITNTTNLVANVVHTFSDDGGVPIYQMVDEIVPAGSQAVLLQNVAGLPNGWTGQVLVQSDRAITGTVFTRPPTPTPTPTFTPTATPIFSPTPTETREPTATPTTFNTVTATATVIATHTPTGVATETPTATATHTPTGVATETPTATVTHTPTGVTTETPTPTATHTPPPTSTATPTRVPPTPSGGNLQIFTISPNEGLNDQAVNVVINGANFTETPQLLLAAHSLQNVVQVDGSRLQATVPAGLAPGSYDLIVINPDGETVILAAAFTVGTALPAISLVRPNEGRFDIPNEISIYGFNFVDGAVVSLDSDPLESVFVNGSTMRATVPAGVALGSHHVSVRNPDESQATAFNAYRAYEPSNDDLYANGYQIWTDPISPRSEEAAKVGVIVNRRGGKNVLQNVTARFYVGDPDNDGTLLGDGTILLLSPRSSDTTSPVNWTPPSPGSYTLYAVIDPENAITETIEINNVVSRTLTVLPPASDEVAPHVDSFAINDDAPSTSERTVSLDATASDPNPSSGLKSILYLEFEYNQNVAQWLPIQGSGWLDYASARSGHPWSLAPAPGVKYLQAWVADNAGNVSLFPFRDTINYSPESDRVGFDQGRIFRFTLTQGQQLTARVTPITGDPDLYVWAPDASTRPPWVSNLSGGDPEEVLIAPAPVDGVYQVEVYGYSAAQFRLEVTISDSVDVRSASVGGGEDPNKDKRTQPLVAVNSEPGAQQVLPTAPMAPPEKFNLYLPAIKR